MSAKLFGIVSVAVFASSLGAQETPKAETPAASEKEPGLYATITTSLGSIVARLYEKESPITVKNFVQLAQGRQSWIDPKTSQKVSRPLYNGLIFHRVIPGFMIQGGDPAGTGMGGTGVIPEERHPSLTFDRPGRLAMANAGPGTGSSQFFITEVPTPHLDDKHTIFGQVVEGQEIVEKIARAPRGENDRPTLPVKIVRVTFARVGPAPPNAPEAGRTSGVKPGAAKAKPAGVKPVGAKPEGSKPAVSKPKTTGQGKTQQ